MEKAVSAVKAELISLVVYRQVRSRCSSGLRSNESCAPGVNHLVAVEWPRGEATACKAVYTGSNPVSTSKVLPVPLRRAAPKGTLTSSGGFAHLQRRLCSLAVSPYAPTNHGSWQPGQPAMEQR